MRANEGTRKQVTKSGDIESIGTASQTVAEMRDVHRYFKTPNGVLEVLRGIDLRVDSGRMIAIVGVSGVGKSTLLHVLGGLDPPTKGVVMWGAQSPYALSDDQRAIRRNREVGFVFQFHHLLPEFNVQENVALPLIIRGETRQQAMELAANTLSDVGLSERLTHLPGEMSGGELQRAAVARALVGGAPLVIADEPSGNLDRRTAEQLHELLGFLAREKNRAIVVATHNADLASRAASVLTVRDGALNDTEGPLDDEVVR